MRRAAVGALRRTTTTSGVSLWPRPAPPGPAHALRARPFSSSTPAPFFFRKPTKSAENFARELLQSRKDDRPDLLAKLYPAFVEAVQQGPSSSSSSSSSTSSRIPLSRVQFQDLMRFAARTGKSRLVLRMFDDAARRLGFQHLLLDHQILLIALCRVGRMNKALDWLESMKDTHGLVPGVSEWNVVVQGYRRAGDLEGMRAVVERMRSHGIEPNTVTYNTVLAALLEHNDLDEVRRVVADMRERGVEPDLWTEQTLLVGFLEAGELASARDVQRRLARMVQPLSTVDKGKQLGTASVDTGALNGLIQFEAVERGFNAGLELAIQYRTQGLPLNALTLNTLVRYGVDELRTAEDAVTLLDRLEDAVGIEPDRHAWSTAITALVRLSRTAHSTAGEGLGEALRAYQLARDRSVTPDSSMIQPLLSALVLPSPTPETLATARELYEDLASSSKSFSTAPDAGIYVTLLRACADPRRPALEWSRALIADMKARGVRLDGASATWHMVALMRAAGSFEEAFASYDEVRALDPSVLDRPAYNTLLSAFTGLDLPDAEGATAPAPAPAPLVMEFLTDMRTSGHPPDSTTYALLLTYYSRAASASPATIGHLHSLIKLDVHLDPDTPLLNALMGAYSRTGAYNAAYRIWDAMVRAEVRGGAAAAVGIDPRSVSILLDTAAQDGSVGAQRRAERVWADLAQGRLGGLRRTPNNWDAWVEALGRWGRIEEAERVVFEEMAPPASPGRRDGANADAEDVPPVAHEGTVRALLKFAMRHSAAAQHRVAQRVQSERPDLWPAVEALARRKRFSSGSDGGGTGGEGGGGEGEGGFFSARTAAERGGRGTEPHESKSP